MGSRRSTLFDAHLYRRGQLITALSRWVCLVLGLVALTLLWNSPRTQPRAGAGRGRRLRRLQRGELRPRASAPARAPLQDRPRRRRRPGRGPRRGVLRGAWRARSGCSCTRTSWPSRCAAAWATPWSWAPSTRRSSWGSPGSTPAGRLGGSTPWRSSGAPSWAARRARTSTTSRARLSERQRGALREERAAPRHAGGRGSRPARAGARRWRCCATPRSATAACWSASRTACVIIQEGRVVYANRVFAADGRRDARGPRRASTSGSSSRPEDRKDLAERYRALGGEPGGLGRPGVARSLTRTGGRAAGQPARGLRGLPGQALDHHDGPRHHARAAHGAGGQGPRRAPGGHQRDRQRRQPEPDHRGHLPRGRRGGAPPGPLRPPHDRAARPRTTRRRGGGRGRRARTRQRAPFTREEVSWAFRRPMAWCHGGEEPPPHLVQGLLAEAGILAVATVPLLSKDRVIGSMNLGRLKATPFSPSDLAVMEPVARHIAIALDNARLLEAVRRRGQRVRVAARDRPRDRGAPRARRSCCRS